MNSITEKMEAILNDFMTKMAEEGIDVSSVMGNPVLVLTHEDTSYEVGVVHTGAGKKMLLQGPPSYEEEDYYDFEDDGGSWYEPEEEYVERYEGKYITQLYLVMVKKGALLAQLPKTKHILAYEKDGYEYHLTNSYIYQEVDADGTCCITIKEYGMVEVEETGGYTYSKEVKNMYPLSRQQVETIYSWKTS